MYRSNKNINKYGIEMSTRAFQDKGRNLKRKEKKNTLNNEDAVNSSQFLQFSSACNENAMRITFDIGIWGDL